ncbi:MAG: hypothetical protein HY078_17420 [Elusimicrobia bacterium]|nr:hypothetical protein [Elusimicrobiota bacterium]
MKNSCIVLLTVLALPGLARPIRAGEAVQDGLGSPNDLGAVTQGIADFNDRAAASGGTPFVCLRSITGEQVVDQRVIPGAVVKAGEVDARCPIPDGANGWECRVAEQAQ